MKEQQSKFECVKEWFQGPYLLMFLNYFSVTWGYRMWYFALSLFFVVLGEMELLLTAIYGFLMSGSVLLFGGVIGDWVDRNNRLTAIRKSLLIQKISTGLCATLICLLLWFQIPINNIWGGILRHLLNGMVIILAIIAELAIISYMRIQLQKDWFVVTTRGKNAKLANLNAGARAIDQLTNILTPILTGQLMTSYSKIITGVIIAVWQIVAIVMELFLLTKIYRMIPEMAQKQKDSNGEFFNPIKNELVNGHTDNTGIELVPDRSSNNKQNGETFAKSEVENETGKKKNRCIRSTFSPLVAMVTGWKIYSKQLMVFAGISLSCLYMTVLSFDNVTTGYVYTNGVPENVVGIVNAVGSFSGLLGAFLFTQLRKYAGLERTGIMSYIWEIICLVFCVISLYVPGSTFKFDALWKSELQSDNADVLNSTLVGVIDANKSDVLIDSTTSSYNVIGYNGTNMTHSIGDNGYSSSFMSQSITMFVVGICASRLGLYITDLVIAQIIQENVPETERGIVNGNQSSLNHLMDMLKFTLVMVLPRIQTFGYLVMLSYLFLCIGATFYMYHCFKTSKFSCKNCISGRSINNKQKYVIEVKENKIEYI